MKKEKKPLWDIKKFEKKGSPKREPPKPKEQKRETDFSPDDFPNWLTPANANIQKTNKGI